MRASSPHADRDTELAVFYKSFVFSRMAQQVKKELAELGRVEVEDARHQASKR